MVEGADGILDLARLRAMSESGQLADKVVRRAGSDVALTADELSSLIGPVSAPPVSTPPVMASYPRAANQPMPPSDDPMRYVLPTNPSFWALISGYIGLGAVLCVPAPFAIITGILGLRDIKKNPHRDGKGRAWFGIIMGILGTIGLIAIGIISLIQSK